MGLYSIHGCQGIQDSAYGMAFLTMQYGHICNVAQAHGYTELSQYIISLRSLGSVCCQGVLVLSLKNCCHGLVKLGISHNHWIITGSCMDLNCALASDYANTPNLHLTALELCSYTS